MVKKSFLAFLLLFALVFQGTEANFPEFRSEKYKSYSEVLNSPGVLYNAQVKLEDNPQHRISLIRVFWKNNQFVPVQGSALINEQLKNNGSALLSYLIFRLPRSQAPPV